jgi:hypothetical protein
MMVACIPAVFTSGLDTRPAIRPTTAHGNCAYFPHFGVRDRICLVDHKGPLSAIATTPPKRPAVGPSSSRADLSYHDCQEPSTSLSIPCRDKSKPLVHSALPPDAMSCVAMVVWRLDLLTLSHSAPLWATCHSCTISRFQGTFSRNERRVASSGQRAAHSWSWVYARVRISAARGSPAATSTW